MHSLSTRFRELLASWKDVIPDAVGRALPQVSNWRLLPYFLLFLLLCVLFPLFVLVARIIIRRARRRAEAA